MKSILILTYFFVPFLSDAQVTKIRSKIDDLTKRVENQSALARRLEEEKNELMYSVKKYKILNRKIKNELTSMTISFYNLRGTLKKQNEEKIDLQNQIEDLSDEVTQKSSLLQSSERLNKSLKSQLESANNTIRNLETELKNKGKSNIVYNAQKEYKERFARTPGYDPKAVSEIEQWEPSSFTTIFNVGFVGTKRFGYAYNLYPGIIFNKNLFVGIGIGQENYPCKAKENRINSSGYGYTYTDDELFAFSTTLINANIRGFFYKPEYDESILKSLYCNVEFGKAFFKRNETTAIKSKNGINLNFGFGAIFSFSEKIGIDANIGYKLQKYSLDEQYAGFHEKDNSKGICLKIGMLYQF